MTKKKENFKELIDPNDVAELISDIITKYSHYKFLMSIFLEIRNQYFF